MDVSHLDWGVSVTRFLSFIENFTATCTFTHVVSHTLVCVSISKHECVSLRRNSSKFFLLSSFVYAFLFNSHMKEGECARALEGFTHQKWKRRQFDTLLCLLGTQSLLYAIVPHNFFSVYLQVHFWLFFQKIYSVLLVTRAYCVYNHGPFVSHRTNQVCLLNKTFLWLCAAADLSYGEEAFAPPWQWSMQEASSPQLYKSTTRT